MKQSLVPIWLAALPALILASAAFAVELTVGDAVPVFAAQDQFGKDYKFQPGVHFLLLGFDMSAAREASQKLADLGPAWLEKHGVVYVMDIHTMPSIARVFALPKMRKYPERIILAEDKHLLDPFPRRPDRLTVLILAPDAKIQEIRYWAPATETTESALK